MYGLKMTHYFEKVADGLWYNLASRMMTNEETTFSVIDYFVPGRFDSPHELKISLQQELRKLEREAIEGKTRDEIENERTLIFFILIRRETEQKSAELPGTSARVALVLYDTSSDT